VIPRDFLPAFRKNVLGAFANGAAWLDSLPEVIGACERDWHIVAGKPFDLSYSYVTPARNARGEEFVLKVCAGGPEFNSEIEALQAWSGGAAVQLLNYNVELGALLLERLLPGQTLATLDDDENATRIAAQLMRDLWLPLPTNVSFSTTADWAGGLQRLKTRFDGGTGPFPRALVETAESLFRELLASSEPPMLLHGDLHHFNMLSAGRRPWVAIDPKGLAGEPAYEVGALLRNPDVRLSTDAQVQRRRLDVLHDELGFDRDRMLGWGVAQAVLSAWWSYEDGGSNWESACACAEVLKRLMR
jgi:streptomycin 6-kinase